MNFFKKVIAFIFAFIGIGLLCTEWNYLWQQMLAWLFGIGFTYVAILIYKPNQDEPENF